MSPRPRSTSTSASTPPTTTLPARRRAGSGAGSTEPPASAKPAAKPPAIISQRTLVKRLFELASERHQPRSSIKLSTGPRGQVMIDLVVHAGDAPGLETVDDVIAYARSRFDALRTVYGVPAPTAGNGEE